MKIQHPTKDTFNQIVGESKVPVLIDFYADWCGPCKMIAPILEEVAEEVGESATICKINVDNEPELAQKFGVMSIPTLVTFKNGEYSTSVGLKNKQALLDMLK